jgi:hypothetical protein
MGYSLPAAIADIVDNSIAARARNVWVTFLWAGTESSVSILDDGRGMSEKRLVEAMRPGTDGPLDAREAGDLGRFGLGLKTASFSQCRKVTVWTRQVKAAAAGRCWDLDYVSRENEWRLLKVTDPPSGGEHGRLAVMRQGTLVTWEKLDRVVDQGTSANDEAAHRRFLEQINEVRDHLAMVFHRYLSGETIHGNAALNIFINGNDQQALVAPWDPFMGGTAARSQQFPKEEIPYRDTKIMVHGYVLPHKDRLSEPEYQRAAGPAGWVAQQGYYIYRNDRILLAGDWLRLGRGRPWIKEEHYKLARLSIDIPNSLDLEWELDVKKSTAKPPPIIRERLTALAEAVRVDARKVFIHRGAYGPRPPGPAVTFQRAWESQQRRGQRVYKINREHPLIAGAIQRLGPLSGTLEQVLRLIEETVPVERIWLDTAESANDHAIPYEGLDEETVKADIKATYQYLRKRGQEAEIIRAYLLATSPFDRYPTLVDDVVQRES